MRGKTERLLMKKRQTLYYYFFFWQQTLLLKVWEDNGMCQQAKTITNLNATHSVILYVGSKRKTHFSFLNSMRNS